MNELIISLPESLKPIICTYTKSIKFERIKWKKFKKIYKNYIRKVNLTSNLINDLMQNGSALRNAVSSPAMDFPLLDHQKVDFSVQSQRSVTAVVPARPVN